MLHVLLLFILGIKTCSPPKHWSTVSKMGFHWQAIDWLYYYSVLLSFTSGVVTVNPVISYVNRHSLRLLHLKIPPSWANQLPKARRWFGYEPFPIYNISRGHFQPLRPLKYPNFSFHYLLGWKLLSEVTSTLGRKALRNLQNQLSL